MLRKTISSSRLIETGLAVFQREYLCKILHSTEADLENWQDGAAEMPWEAFERLLEIVLEHQKTQAEHGAAH
jgi:hypothetical protein